MPIRHSMALLAISTFVFLSASVVRADDAPHAMAGHNPCSMHAHEAADGEMNHHGKMHHGHGHMLRDLADIVRRLKHHPTAADKTKLDEMIAKLDKMEAHRKQWMQQHGDKSTHGQAMGERIVMLRRLMEIVRDLKHYPSADEKAELDGMVNRLDAERMNH